MREEGYELTYNLQTVSAPTRERLGLEPEALSSLAELVDRAFATTRFRATEKSVRELVEKAELEGLGPIARQRPPGPLRPDPSDRYVVPRLREVSCADGECRIEYNADTPDALQEGLSADPPPPEDEIIDDQFYLWQRLFTDPTLERATLVAYGRSGKPYVTVSCDREAIEAIYGTEGLDPRREHKTRCRYEQADEF